MRRLLVKLANNSLEMKSVNSVYKSWSPVPGVTLRGVGLKNFFIISSLHLKWISSSHPKYLTRSEGTTAGADVELIQALACEQREEGWEEGVRVRNSVRVLSWSCHQITLQNAGAGPPTGRAWGRTIGKCFLARHCGQAGPGQWPGIWTRLGQLL